MDVHSERRTWTCVRQGGQVLKTWKGWEGAYSYVWTCKRKSGQVGRRWREREGA